MRRHLLLPIALALLVAAWATGCSGKPISNIPPDEPGAAPAQTEESGGTEETTPAAAAVPTIAPQREEVGMTLAPAGPEVPEQVPTVEPGPVTGEVPQDLLDAILDDAEARSGIKPDGITIVRAEAVIWNDGSLGCPEPGVVYTQALVSGYWVVLEADGDEYDYRANDRRIFFLCQQRLPPRIGTPSGDADKSQERPDVFPIYGVRASHSTTPSRSPDEYEKAVLEGVTADLAARLKISLGSIAIIRADYSEVQLAAPCGTTTAEDEAGAMPGGLALGYEVVLEEGGTQYRYVAVGGLGYYCGAE